MTSYTSFGSLTKKYYYTIVKSLDKTCHEGGTASILERLAILFDFFSLNLICGIII